jgi:hypothetical protein
VQSPDPARRYREMNSWQIGRSLERVQTKFIVAAGRRIHMAPQSDRWNGRGLTVSLEISPWSLHTAL